jgi:phosphate transport system substrate-binding protein
MRVRKKLSLVLGLLVVLLAAIAAGCGGGSDTTSAAPATGATESGGSSSGTIVLNGSGATFPEPIYVKWAGEYHAANPGVQVNYQGIGSGGGIEQFTDGITDFGASDAPMSDDELAAAQAKGGDVLHIPTVVGSVAITYNLPGVTDLKLDGPTLADIYLGTITKWNDPKITALNPGVTLPGDDIKVVHRSDSSGTSYIFTGYLTAVSPDWSSKVGQDKAPEWPTGIGGQGNDGVAAAVQQTQGGIGYNELAYALQNKLAYASLKNANGEWIKPSLDSTTAAGQGVTYPDDLRFSLLNSKAPGAYPIVSATWQLLWQDPSKAGMSRDKAKALVQFVTWELSTGQKLAPDLNYAPLPTDLQSAAIKLLDSVVLPS